MTGATGAAGEPRFAARVIALCALATFLDGYDLQALALALPGMARGFGVAPTAFAAALSGTLVGMTAGAMLLAPLADRFGRKPMLIAMLLLVSVTTGGAALATSPALLLPWRVAAGFGLGAIVPIAIAMTAERAPPRRRVLLITLMIACSPFGSFAAGMIAPAAEARFGWRGIFAIGAVLPLAAAAVMALALPAMRVIAATTAAPRGSVAGLFGPVLRSRTILLWTIFWFNLFAVYSLISWLPTLLVSAGWALPAAQRATGLLALGGIAGGLLLAWLADRGLAIRVLICAYLGAAVLLPLFLIAPQGRWWLALIALTGASAVGAQMALGSLAATFYPVTLRTTGLGWSSGIGRIGSIAGPLALAALMHGGVPSASILALLTIPMLICAACTALLTRALARTE